MYRVMKKVNDFKKEYIEHYAYPNPAEDYEIKNINSDNPELWVFGEHNFRKNVSQSCYDSEGNYLGIFNSYEDYREKKWCKIPLQKQVFQIGFDFYLLPIGRAFTIDELDLAERILKKTIGSFKRLSYYPDIETVIDIKYFSDDPYLRKRLGMNIITKRGLEYRLLGNSKALSVDIGDSFIDVDYSRYKSNFNKFILNNPEHEFRAEKLYNANIGYAMDYYGCNEDKLTSKKNSKIDLLIKKIENEACK